MNDKLIITRDAFRHGNGAPTSVPDFIGQPYIDTDSRTVWHAVSLDGPEYWSTSNSLNTSNLPFIVVTDLGAIPDGVTPCSYAINQAIEQASTMSQIGAVYLPGGTYLIDAPILLKDNLYLFGDGFTVLKQANLSDLRCVMEYYSGTQAGTQVDTQYNITISNLIIDGNNQTNTTYTGDEGNTINCGILMEHAHNCHFNSVEVRNCGYDGIVLNSNTSCDRNMFSNVSVRNCGRYGVNIGSSCSHNRFDNCMIEFSGYTNIKCDGTFNIFNSCRFSSSRNSSGITINNSDNVVSSCEIVENATQGIYCNSADYTSIVGCRLAGNSRVSSGSVPHIEATGTGIHISGNHFVGSVSSTTGTGFASECIKLGVHNGCNFSGNSVYFNTVDSRLDLSSQFIEGLSVGDILNGVTIINGNHKPAPTLGLLYLEEDTGFMTYYNFSSDEWVVIENQPGDTQDLVVNSLVSSTSVRANTMKASTSVESPVITVTNSITTKNLSATGTTKLDSASITNTLTAKKLSSTTAEVTESFTTKMLEATNSLTTPLVTATKVIATDIEVSSMDLDSASIDELTCNSLVIGTNKLLFGDSVPTTGTYKSGDLIINTATSSDIILWKYCGEGTGWVELKINSTPQDPDSGGGTT